MALTRERKVLFVVLGLGAMALLMDRLVLSSGSTGPHSAAANAQQSAPATANGTAQNSGQSSAPPRVSLEAMKKMHTEPTLDQRIADAAEAQGLAPTNAHDAFTVSSAWIGEPEPENPAQPVEPAPSQQADERARLERSSLANRFREQHVLMAVMTNQGDGVAIVDGMPVRVGQQVDGFTLEDVQRRKATFVSGPMRVELTLPQDR